jgi:hypothetical protein
MNEDEQLPRVIPIEVDDEDEAMQHNSESENEEEVTNSPGIADKENLVAKKEPERGHSPPKLVRMDSKFGFNK